MNRIALLVGVLVTISAFGLNAKALKIVETAISLIEEDGRKLKEC